MHRTWKYLGSLRFTVVVIALLAGIFLAGLWIPQKGVLQQELYLSWQAASPRTVACLDLLGFTEIYTSPVTLCLWLLFFLNLALVMRQRLPLVAAKISLSERKLEDPALAAGYPFKSATPLTAALPAAHLESLLSRRGYRFYGTPELFYGVRHRYSPLASLLFHLSFFLILLGGVVSVYTRFVGNLDIAQGESFNGEPERYTSMTLPKLGAPPRVSVRVESITPEVERDTPTALKVRLVDGEGERHLVDINRPYKQGRVSLVIKNLGVAPLVVLRDRSGREVDGAYAKLNVLRGKRDSFSMGGFRFDAHFYPDYAVRNGVEGSLSEEFRNPAFTFDIVRDGRALGHHVARPGDTVAFEDYLLTVREVPFWVRFVVVQEYGLEILYAGFAMATIGLIWRLIFYRREIVGALRTEEGGQVLLLAGRSEYYRSLAEDEFRELVDWLQKKSTATTRGEG